jgi:hypothetical protein
MLAMRYATKLSPLVLALCSTSAIAATTVNTSTTTPLKTSTAGDITVDNGGTITVSGQPAITVDSSNNVTTNVNGTTSNGALVASNSNNSGGILVNPGLTSTLTINGNISALENYTVTNVSGTTTAAGPIANTTGRYGILVNGAGTGTITTAGTITVKGLQAYGLRVVGPYTGSITNTGTMQVIGDNSVALQTTSVSGGLTVGGTVTVTGSGAQDVVAGGDIGGALTIQGVVSQTSSYTTDSATTQMISKDDLQTGKAAVEVDGNVAGGILVYSLCSPTTINNVASCTSSNTTSTTGSIASVGNSPALQIGGANNITIAANALSINGNKYSLAVDGSITSSATYASTDTAALVVGGNGGNVSMPGGIGVTGTISATGVDQTATGVLINTGSTVPSIVNSGTISASLSQAGGVAAFGVRDLSGTLTSITNNGTISATAGVTSRAVDLSANTTGVTYTQGLNAFETQEQIQEQATAGYTLATAKVYVATVGDIVTGSGNDTINITSGTVTGNGIFGGGNDTVSLSNDAKWTGNLTFGAGSAAVTLSKTAQFTGAVNADDMPLTVTVGDTAQFLATAVTGGSKLDVAVNGGSFGAAAAQTIAIRNLTIASGGTLTAFIDGTSGTSSLIQAQTATFGTGSKVAASISSLNFAVGNYKILTATTLNGNPTFDSSTTVLPVLFKGSVTEQANSLYLDIARKTAADLGLNSSETSGYNAIYANALVNATLADSLLQVADVPTLQAQMDALLPDSAGATFDFVSRADRMVTRHLTDNSSIYDISNIGGWIEPVYFRGSKDATGTSAYTLDGYGLSLGLERKVGASRVGISLAWISGKLHDGNTEDISATSYEVGAFWRLSKGPFYAFAKAAANRVSFNSTRTFTGEVDLAALTYTATGHWAGWAVSGSAGVSYQFDLTSTLNLKPMVVLDYIRLKENSYAEAGSTPILLNVDGRTSDSFAATTTVTAGWSMGEVTRDERPLTLEFEGGRRNQISGNVGSTTASFSGGDPFTITPDSLSGGWLGEARMLFGGMDYTWQFSTRAEQLAGKADVSARVSLSLAM